MIEDPDFALDAGEPFIEQLALLGMVMLFGILAGLSFGAWMAASSLVRALVS